MTGYCTGFHGVDYRGFDGRLVTAAETDDAAADGSAIRRVRPCGERSIAPFPNRRVIPLPSLDPRPGFDPILFHSSGGVGNELMSVVELNAITGVGQYLSHETLEFQEFFLRPVMFLLNYQPNFARVEHGRAPTGVCRV